MSDARLPWDPFQREMLEALGHVVYAAQDRDALAAQAADAADAGAPPLLRALAHAAKSRVAQLPALPPIEHLHTPAAKRALWPTLRALRKASRG
ncbi:hypothetical protein LYSHEL_08580 [Lysobacter helvus]|uniref:Uncharacterized protein n=2 Tax=Lysobacteraceae TaxID=32033 RepID=A0ABM7Q3J3_9GAMM|nr:MULTISPECIES: hypothetical protein [Lysobacter]BCT91834.1 hypothetical protein LYSCAS_08580 [Lysobacter caseinilyticus]BCT94987.1 hypothetical protein LYSHEL_08580 [Lysobacter helvus]